jgi:hypothetical protein
MVTLTLTDTEIQVLYEALMVARDYRDVQANRAWVEHRREAELAARADAQAMSLLIPKFWKLLGWTQ